MDHGKKHVVQFLLYHQLSHELQNHGEELGVSVDEEASLFVHGMLEAALQWMVARRR